MSYQRQVSNGTVIESINGKHYINGVEVETGKLKPGCYALLFVITLIGILVGFVTGYVVGVT